MVSNARDDFPDPLSPVITVSVLRGISTLMFFRLCWRAPRTLMCVMAMLGSLVLQFRGRTHRVVRKRMSAAVLPYLNRQYPCWSNEGRVFFRDESERLHERSCTFDYRLSAFSDGAC